jgi:hypothetical protein
MTNAPTLRCTKLIGPSAAAAASLAFFAAAALLPASADAAQDPNAPPPQPAPTTTTPAAPGSTVIVQQPQPQPQPQPTVVAQEPAPLPPRWQEQPREETHFDDSFDLYLSPGTINVPFGGEDDVDYFDRFNPGYQWGLGMGWFERGDDSNLAIGVGGFFDHLIINSEARQLDDITDRSHSVFRLGLELRPGVVLGERVFLYLPIRGGYAANVLTGETANDDVDVDVDHGPYVGVAGGLDIAIYKGLYIGTTVGPDFHFFRAGNDHDFYTVSWRALIGYRF